MSTTSASTKAARPEPRLCTDYCGELYIVIDDDGEPVSDYQTDPNVAHRIRNGLSPGFRICRVAYRIIDENPVVHDGGGGQPVADEHERVRREGYNAGYGDALRDEFRRETVGES